MPLQHQKEQKKTKKKNRVSICKNVKISKYPYGFSGTHGVSPNPHMFQVWVLTHTHMGAGFTGTGLGWTAQTHTRPVCHPKDPYLGHKIKDQTELIKLMLSKCNHNGDNSAIVCLDQEKAYDKISHDFLWATLE